MNLSRLKENLKNWIRKFFLINDTPHKIAGGAALGIFLGITPGEGVLATLFLSSLFRLNRLAALAGLGVVNIWTTFLVFPLAAAVGSWIFGIDYESLKNNFHGATESGIRYFFSKAIFFDLTLPLMVGFAVVAGVISALVYFGLLYLLINKKHLRKDTHMLEKKIILQVRRNPH
ncbi:MAG: DUF2062 domain-containing protein [Parcubacteria group bacterium]|jgi:uncharacterized protein (DUF2062 family)